MPGFSARDLAKVAKQNKDHVQEDFDLSIVSNDNGSDDG